MSELREEIELPQLETDPELSAQKYWPTRCRERERQLKASLAANREQKAEIERLKDELSAADTACEEGSEIVNELASLRASVGEKWIDVKQELPTKTGKCLAIREGFTEASILWFNNVDMKFEEMSSETPIDVTYHQPLPAPPTLPGEEK